MDQNGSGRQDQMSEAERPPIMEELSATQLNELETYYRNDDRDLWNTRVHDYGWSDQDAQAVRQWFDQRPPMGEEEMAASPG